MHPAFIPQPQREPERPRLYLPIEAPEDRRPTSCEPEPERGVWIVPFNGVEDESEVDPPMIVFRFG